VVRTVIVASVVATLLVAGASPARAQENAAAPAQAPEGFGDSVPGAPEPPPVSVPAAPEPPEPPVEPLPQAVPPATHHEPRTVLFVAGYLAFMAVYGLTLMASAIVWRGGIDNEGPCSDCKSQAVLFAIPVAGPWLADTDPRDLRYVAVWSGLEAVSLAMIIVGAIGHEVPNAPVPAPLAKLSVVPLVTSQAEMLSVRMAW
jgi:hypothetical protein